MYNVEEIKNLGLKDIHVGPDPTDLGVYLWIAAGAVLCLALLWVILRHCIPVFRDLSHLTSAFLRADNFAGEMGRILKNAALRYFPREKVASLSGTRWLEFLDHTGLCHLSRTVSDWDSMAYGGHILTRSERRSLYRQGFLWLCSNVWRRP